MHDPNHSEPPLNPLPPAVAGLAFVLIGIEVMFLLGERGLYGGPMAVGWRSQAIQDWGFSVPVLKWMLANGHYPPEHLLRFLTYPLIHYSFSSALFAAVILLAVGKRVGEIFGNIAFLVIFWASAVSGALVFGLLTDDRVPLVGAFPGVYGVIGALSFAMWIGLRAAGENPWRAFSLIGALLGLQLFFKLAFGGPNFWVADVAGFAVGLVTGAAISPVGQAVLRLALARMRRR